MPRKPTGPLAGNRTLKEPPAATAQRMLAQARLQAKRANNQAIALGHQRPAKPAEPKRDRKGRFT
jgi:hypothetical protein